MFLKAKTIFVQDYDEDANLLETFKRIIFYSDTEIQDFLHLVQGKGFVDITNDESKKLPIVEKPPSIVNREMQDNLRLLYRKKKFALAITDSSLENNNRKEKIKERKDNPNLVHTLDSIKNFKHYRIEFNDIAASRSGIRWTRIEDRAMKEETSLAIIDALYKKYEVPIEISPKNIIKDQLQTPIMGWDKILFAGERMFLVETEHNITLVSIDSQSSLF